MGHYVFVSEFVFYKPVREHKRHKREIIKHVNKKKSSTEGCHEGKWLSKVNTEFFKKEDASFYYDFITSEVYPALTDMFNTIEGIVAPKVSKVKDIWYNNYEEGGNQEVHTHNGADISGIYIVELNERNPTVFYSYIASLVKFSNNTFKTDFLKEGTIILFPSNLLHYVLETYKNRITVAFNIECEF